MKDLWTKTTDQMPKRNVPVLGCWLGGGSTEYEVLFVDEHGQWVAQQDYAKVKSPTYWQPLIVPEEKK